MIPVEEKAQVYNVGHKAMRMMDMAILGDALLSPFQVVQLRH